MSQPSIPDLVFTADDVNTVPFSSINAVDFIDCEREMILRRLHEIAVIEKRLQTESRLWEHDTEAYSETMTELNADMLRAKKDLYGILLYKTTFPKRPELILSLSDVYHVQDIRIKDDPSFVLWERLPFQSSDFRNVASNIEMLLRHQVQLNNELTNASRYDTAERHAMIHSSIATVRLYKSRLVSQLIATT